MVRYRELLKALGPLHPRLRHRPDKMPLPDDPRRLRGLKDLYLTTDFGMIDLLGELPGGCAFEELAGRPARMDLGGFECRGLSSRSSGSSILRCRTRDERFFEGNLPPGPYRVGFRFEANGEVREVERELPDGFDGVVDLRSPSRLDVSWR